VCGWHGSIPSSGGGLESPPVPSTVRRWRLA
jgi:hypothetical protein